MDGFIIIGYDTKTKSHHSTSFKESRLKDSAHLNDIINKKIDRLFDLAVYDFAIDGNGVSVIHIPPSVDKPHVIRSYQVIDKNGNTREEHHKIFVRKGTSTYPASKYDIELMFYDRKNLVPDYKVLCSFPVTTLNLSVSSHYSDGKQVVSAVKASMNLILENLGRRPIAVIGAEVSFSMYPDPSFFEKISYTTKSIAENSEIIVQPNQIVGVTISLESDYGQYGFSAAEGLINQLNERKRQIIPSPIELILSTGEKLKCELRKISN